MLEQELQKLGLSQKEAAVYLSALELGQSSVQKISQKAGVNRATTYVILEGLMKKGIVTTFDKGKKRYFAAESPDSLVGLLRKQEQEIKNKEEDFKKILPELRSVFNLAKDRPVVKYYEGKEGINNIQKDFSISKEKKSFQYIPLDAVYKFFPQDSKHRKDVKTIGFKSEAIYVSESGEKLTGENKWEVPFKKFPFRSEVIIYDAKVVFVNYEKKLNGVVIEDEEISQTMKAIFELAKRGAQNLDK